MSPCNKNLRDLSLAALREMVVERGLPSYTVDQLVLWLCQKGVDSFAAMTNVSQLARERLEKQFSLSLPEVVHKHHAQDGAQKFLLRLHDGQTIESVLIPGEGRWTQCLSSQVGCAMACDFCRTGEMGLKRNLTQGEILGQVLAVRQAAPEVSVTNLVFMGMGEPLHNLDTLVNSLEFLLAQRGFNFSKRRITVSTSGLIPPLRELVKRVPVKIAISLNASHDAQRSELMPINRRYPMAEIAAFCRDYRGLSRFRVTFEYVMLHGVNDTPADLQRLIEFCRSLPVKLNLIPFNPYEGSPYVRPPKAHVETWRSRLLAAGIQTNIRVSKGLDILAACGQLATPTRQQVPSITPLTASLKSGMTRCG